MTNILFQNALLRQKQNIPPIWFMRQAGRYHSHYRSLKEKYTFEQLCKSPELAAEVANGPINEFDFDVAILFSDILYVLGFPETWAKPQDSQGMDYSKMHVTMYYTYF